MLLLAKYQWGAVLPALDQDLGAIAIPIIVLGALLLLLGLLLLIGPQIAAMIRGISVPEPLRSLLVIGVRAGSIEIYTSPLLIIALLAIYGVLLLRR